MIDFPTTIRPTELDRENVAIISEVEPEHRSGAAIVSRALAFYVQNALPRKSASVARRNYWNSKQAAGVSNA